MSLVGGVQRAHVGKTLADFSSSEKLSSIRLCRQHNITELLDEFNDGAVAADPQISPVAFEPLACALLDHRFQAAIQTAQAGDEPGFMAHIKPMPDNRTVVRTLLGDKIGLAAANHDYVAPRLGEAPAYLVGTPSVVFPREELGMLTESALTSIANAGLQPLLEAAGLIILVHERELFGLSNSWTTTALPSTIYSDYVLDPIAFGAELVHEAAHLWLNDALAATGDLKPCQKVFESPWKGEPRQAFGFLHAVFAFSIVVHYLRWALAEEGLAYECRRYLIELRKREAMRLESAANDLSIVLALINSDLAAVVADIHQRALSS